jgi:hypothetical protein
MRAGRWVRDLPWARSARAPDTTIDATLPDPILY